MQEYRMLQAGHAVLALCALFPLIPAVAQLTDTTCNAAAAIAFPPGPDVLDDGTALEASNPAGAAGPCEAQAMCLVTGAVIVEEVNGGPCAESELCCFKTDIAVGLQSAVYCANSCFGGGSTSAGPAATPLASDAPFGVPEDDYGPFAAGPYDDPVLPETAPLPSTPAPIGLDDPTCFAAATASVPSTLTLSDGTIATLSDVDGVGGTCGAVPLCVSLEAVYNASSILNGPCDPADLCCYTATVATFEISPRPLCIDACQSSGAAPVPSPDSSDYDDYVSPTAAEELSELPLAIPPSVAAPPEGDTNREAVAPGGEVAETPGTAVDGNAGSGVQGAGTLAVLCATLSLTALLA